MFLKQGKFEKKKKTHQLMLLELCSSDFVSESRHCKISIHTADFEMLENQCFLF